MRYTLGIHTECCSLTGATDATRHHTTHPSFAKGPGAAGSPRWEVREQLGCLDALPHALRHAAVVPQRSVHSGVWFDDNECVE
eukprot:scaffold17867_cov40-Phaeocystis_antarctica.AAC.6